MSEYRSKQIDLNEIRQRVAMAPPQPAAGTDRNRVLTICALILGILFVFFLAQPRPQTPAPLQPILNLPFAELDYNTDSTALYDASTPAVALLTVKSHQDWSRALDSQLLPKSMRSNIIKAVRASDNSNQLTVPHNNQLRLYLDRNTNEVLSVGYQLNPITNRLLLRQANGSFIAEDLNTSLRRRNEYVSATVKTSLHDTLTELDLPKMYADEIANAFPNDWTLSSGGEAGDRFELVYETLEDEQGRAIGPGDLLYVSYKGKVASDSRYFFTPSDTGIRASYDGFGNGAEPLLTRNPVNGKRITSSFGNRRHPVKGYSHLHTGVDFAGRMGSNVYAAGDGIIDQIRTRSGYGRYLAIRHADGYVTTYSHLSGFERNLKVGQVVRRGELVGYVGMSGTVTAPHLHFEVKKNGRFVNPMRIKLPEGRSLPDTPDQLNAFRMFKVEIDNVRHTRRSEIEIESQRISQQANMATRSQLSP